MTEQIKKLADECRAVAEHYEKFPGAAGPGANAGTIVDIFRTIARLADTLIDGERR